MIHTMEQPDNLETIYKKKDSRSEKFQSGIFFIFGIIFIKNSEIDMLTITAKTRIANINHPIS